MPNNMIKKDAERGYGSEKKLERKWDEAKDAAGKKDGKQNWALTNFIYQRKKKHASVSRPSAHNAALRLKLTAEVMDGASTDPEQYAEDEFAMEGFPRR